MRTYPSSKTVSLLAGLLLALVISFAPAAENAPPAPPDGASFDELQEGADGLARELEGARKIANELAAEIARGKARTAAIPAEIGALRADLAKAPLPEVPPAAEDAVAVAAYEKTSATHAETLEKITELELEAARYQNTGDRVAEQKRSADERVAALSSAIARWQKSSDAARTKEAAETRAAVRERADGFADESALAKLADENAALAARRASASVLVSDAHHYASMVASESAYFERERLAAERRVRLLESAKLGIDAETGKLLRAQREKLPSARELRSKLKLRLRESAEAGLARLTLQSERDGEGFADMDAKVAEVVAEAERARLTLQSERDGEGFTDMDAKVAEAGKSAPDPAAVRSLLEERRQIYDDFAADLERRSTALTTANETAKRTVDAVNAYARYLDERLLWIPSADPVNGEDFVGSGDALRTLGGLVAGGGWISSAAADFKASPLPWLVTALALGYLLIRRRSFRRTLLECGVIAVRRNCQSFSPTAIAFGCTLLLAIPLPLALGFLAWRCEHPSALGAILLSGAIFTALVGSARLLSRQGGVLESHFRLEPERTRLLHRHLNWFLPLGGLVIVVAAALPQVAPPPAGRLLFMLAMLTLMVLLHLILRPAKGLVRRRGGQTRFAYVWYWAGILIPAGLALGAGLGYFESVLALRLRAVGSLWLLLVVLFCTGLLLRWILVSRRRLAVDQALHRRAAAAAAREGEGAPELPSLEKVKAEAVDLASVEGQTSRLVHLSALVAILFGLFGIWADTLPALSVLDKVKIWPADELSAAPAQGVAMPGADVVSKLTPTPSPEGAEPATGASIGAAEPLRELIRPTEGGVSLGDLLFAIVLLFFTFAAARNIPGLLELTILRRLTLRPGSSFALTTTVRYLIVVVGVVIAFGKIGITWSKVQWIAAAITLGVGFGLQEVFANFVAGLILLFERPFRIGDVVTVGDVSGTVSQIRMRATTIRQFNSRELVVPNKDFITGQLVNWTLTDGVLRIEVPVGIAYGSNTEQVRDLLLGIAHKHPHIIAEPEPQVVFSAFGDSALNFELRVHVGSIDHNLSTKTDLHYAIEKAFREAGIEIAFPQTDIHIRSMPESETPDA